MKKLILQSHDGDSLCDQTYIMDIKTGKTENVSAGESVTTCSYFVHPDCEKIIYGSNHVRSKSCL